MDWAWRECIFVNIHQIDDFWVSVGGGFLHGDFVFLVFIHVIVCWWLDVVEEMGGGGLWTASAPPAAAVSASAIVHGLRREVRTKATMAINSVGRATMIEGAEVGVVDILGGALLEEVRMAGVDDG